MSRTHFYLAAALLAATGCEHQPAEPGTESLDAYAVRAAAGTRRPPFTFSPEDEAFLDEVQRGAFNYLWHAGEKSGTGMAPDRTSKPTVSVAGVGFQLTGICIGVERGWITREQGRARAKRILDALAANPDNRKAGLFYHFVHHDTAGQPAEAYEHVVSTIDSALLFAGILTASQYFGGDVAAAGDPLFAAADWTFFIAGLKPEPIAAGFVTLGWRPADIADPAGDGSLIQYAWIDSGDEHKLVTFLAVCAPDEKHRVDPQVYYRLRRQLGEYGDGRFAWFPWSGALFTSFFAHCWIDYARIGPDDPAAFNMPQRVRVDWWENARRTALMHRRKAIENPMNLPGLGENAWGLTASDVERGYAVPGLFPRPVTIPGAIPHRDFPVATAKDNYGDGTLAPYGAGSCIMFLPDGAVAALRHYRAVVGKDGTPLWSDPASGGYGFADAFNAGSGWVGKDHLAIDQGPLLLAIENARTGFVWETFHAHPAVRAGMDRLKLKRRPP